MEQKWGIQMMSQHGDIDLESLNLDYTATASLKKSNRHSYALDLEIKLTRKFLRSFLELIAPPGMLVVVSWVKCEKMKKWSTPFENNLPIFRLALPSQWIPFLDVWAFY